MNRKDFVLALVVVTIWGANFTIIKLGLPLPLFWKVNHERHE